MFHFDLGSMKEVGRFKSISGAVVDISCPSGTDFAISASLDRHIRVHQLSSHRLLQKVIHCSCLSFLDSRGTWKFNYQYCTTDTVSIVTMIPLCFTNKFFSLSFIKYLSFIPVNREPLIYDSSTVFAKIVYHIAKNRIIIVNVHSSGANSLRHISNNVWALLWLGMIPSMDTRQAMKIFGKRWKRKLDLNGPAKSSLQAL